jgi:hypothetical protein
LDGDLFCIPILKQISSVSGSLLFTINYECVCARFIPLSAKALAHGLVLVWLRIRIVNLASSGVKNATRTGCSRAQPGTSNRVATLRPKLVRTASNVAVPAVKSAAATAETGAVLSGPLDQRHDHPQSVPRRHLRRLRRPPTGWGGVNMPDFMQTTLTSALRTAPRPVHRRMELRT